MEGAALVLGVGRLAAGALRPSPPVGGFSLQSVQTSPALAATAILLFVEKQEKQAKFLFMSGSPRILLG